MHETQILEIRMARRNGFTLVELLVVLAIIGLLIALLLPAIQSARSSARLSACANSQRQVGLAVQQFANNSDRLPALARHANRSWTAGPTVGWRFSVLPFLEEQAMFDALRDGRWQVKSKSSDWNRPPRREEYFEKLAAVPPAKRPARVASFQCSVAPESQSVIATHGIEKNGEWVYDGVGLSDELNPSLIPASVVTSREEYLKRVGNFDMDYPRQAAAWYGRSYWLQDREKDDSLAKFRGAKLSYFSDGLSNTILLMEFGRPAEHFRVHTSRGLPIWFLSSGSGDNAVFSSVSDNWWSYHGEPRNVVMADGSVRSQTKGVDWRVLLALLGRQDGG